MPPVGDLGLSDNELAVPISVQVHFREEFLDTLYCGDFHYTRQDQSGSQSEADPIEPHFTPSDTDAKLEPPRVNRTASGSSHGRRGRKTRTQVTTRHNSYVLLRVPRSPNYHEPEGSPLNLEFTSALQTLCEDWTEEELEIGRRLAKFTTIREGNKFVLSCEVIRQEAYDPEDVVISCIYYKYTDEYYVTSVDILYLFENVADEALGTSEKTRLRRNIQSFLPTRVEKADREYGGLYTQIMKFPPPKPRTIEKKIKVFRWVLLEDILSKIASKYHILSSGLTSRPQSPRLYHSPSLPDVITRSTSLSSDLDPQEGASSDIPMSKSAPPYANSLLQTHAVVPILSPYSASPPPTSYSPYDTLKYTLFDSYGHGPEAASYSPTPADATYPTPNYEYHPYTTPF
ncbi:hypothetical protein BDM02DRAFT_3185070 [Thelephora ganbajun]|uniref:Uncharacterized protein n=1 Tax=Thelephora ganbajun TaxID=370292 RepID=A0ACB6ZN03_THEGA|nr:hypothetical protein BDM02DRAFT_3185070 [Thelephora ganbajun]